MKFKIGDVLLDDAEPPIFRIKIKDIRSSIVTIEILEDSTDSYEIGYLENINIDALEEYYILDKAYLWNQQIKEILES